MATNKYSKKVILEFETDKDALQKVEEDLNAAGQQIEQSVAKSEKKAEASAKKFSIFTEAIKFSSSKLVESLKDFPGAAGTLGKVIDGFSDGFAEGLENIGDMIIDAFKAGAEEMQNILRASQLSNASTRETMFQYGFSQSEAYGYQKALKLTGLTSMEDLMYADYEQRQEFTEAFTEYSQKYSQLYDSGFFKELQRYNFEMADFNEQVNLQIVEFMVDNKDTIMTAMKGLIMMSEAVITGFAWLIDRFTGDTGRATSSEIVSQAIRNNQTNINISNQYNNVAKEDTSWLANAGQSTYKQIIDALNNA